MLEAHYVEQRVQKLPGQKPTTVFREVTLKNGHARKTIKVYEGKKLISSVSEPISTTEKTNIQQRKFNHGLFNSAETKTLRNLLSENESIEPVRRKTKKNRKTKRTTKKRFGFF
jgi:hypothetical protein